MKNAENFIDYFNKIEKLLRNQLKSDKHESFSTLVYEASRKNKIVSRYNYDLKEFADLRNAIIHERTDGHIIAEPFTSTVENLRQIYELLIKPPLAKSVRKPNVQILLIHDSIKKALKLINDHFFSQIPIYDNKKMVGLITTNTISRWLAAHIKEDLVSIEETNIEDVLPYTEFKNNYLLLDRTTTVFDVIEYFNQSLLGEGNIEAILITETGKVDERPIAIYTPWDIPLLNKAIIF